MAKFLDTSGLTYLWGKIMNALNAKANVVDLADVATSGSYSDLSGVPTEGFNMQFNSDGSINAVNRPVQLNGVQKQGAATHTAINFIPGSNIQIETADASNATNWTFSATDTKPNSVITDNTPDPVPIASSMSWSCIYTTPIVQATANSIWLIYVCGQFPNNTNGFRGVGIGTTNSGATGPGGAIMQQTVAPANGAATNILVSTFVSPTQNTNYYIWARQNSGDNTMKITYRYRAVRIL